jgi:hypothetical protein
MLPLTHIVVDNMGLRAREGTGLRRPRGRRPPTHPGDGGIAGEGVRGIRLAFEGGHQGRDIDGRPLVLKGGAPRHIGPGVAKAEILAK